MLYSKNIAPINIQFTTSHTLYDSTLTHLSDPYINLIPSSLEDHCIESQILFINDPIDMVHKDKYFSSIINNKVIFFHDDKILRMKKEDLFLFREQIAKYIKFTFDPKICSIITDAVPIQYGFKSNNTISKNRDKSIIFLGNEQNIDMIAYNHIKQIYNDIDFINIEKVITKDISNILNNYKVCISMSSMYNSLLAAANGCFVISSIEDNKDILYYQKVNSFEEILQKLSLILNNYNHEYHKQISDSILQKYDYSVFVKNITNIVKTTCNRAIIL